MSAVQAMIPDSNFFHEPVHDILIKQTLPFPQLGEIPPMFQLYPIDDVAWQHLLELAADSFDELTLMRGFQFHKQGRVTAIEMSDSNTIQSSVYGTEPYEQFIYLDFPNNSECDCKLPRMCTHIAAVLIEYAHREGRPVQSFVSARALNNRSQSTSSNAIRRVPAPTERMTDEPRMVELSGQLESLHIKQWHELFALCLKPLESRARDFQYTESALSTIASRKPDLPLTTELLFELHAYFYVMEKLIETARGPVSHAGYYADYYIGQSIKELRSAILGLFKEPLSLLSGEDPLGRVADTLAVLRKGMLRKTVINSHYAAAYYQFWRSWVGDDADHAALYAAELRAINSAFKELGAEHEATHARLACCWMHLLSGHDELAIGQLTNGQQDRDIPPVHLLEIFARLSEQQAWNRLLYWLVESKHAFMDRRREGMRNYFDYWGLVVDHLPESEDRMWETIGGMLPYSRHVYNDLLIRYGKWKQWMDLQLTTDSDPFEFRVTDLQPIEKASPELLLPFYHQAVERYVLIRNRKGYKSAVKLMKRLAKLYKKLKQEERWTDYMEAFVARYSRLRALQEELRKGKLLS